MRLLRLLPVVLLAAIGLLVLKAAGFVDAAGPAPAAAAAAHGEPAAEEPEEPEAPPLGLSTVPPLEFAIPAPGAGTEVALLERLAERRAELDARAAELDLREQILAAAEARMEERLAELRAIEARIAAAVAAEDAARAAEVAGLIAMYEAMRPGDAAAVFERLDMEVLRRLATAMNPRKMAPILAEMSPQTAGQLTALLASAGDTVAAPAAPSLADLPQIAPAT